MLNTPTTSQFELANRVAGGQLAEKIQRYRDLGVSWPAISALLLDEHQLELNVETLRRWGKVICATEPAEAVS